MHTSRETRRSRNTKGAASVPTQCTNNQTKTLKQKAKSLSVLNVQLLLYLCDNMLNETYDASALQRQP